ncbi:hypothetical protein B0T14DRAFT_336843 [Immersiella caudata]|uniref:Uncharacterized protein n=1 Tax=Immersiella caudata TaxID=314043 RepID=A0AA39TLM7_9PEZI|nr:hypothetical protein B0T14DRAFT_336843 [Immersiella caudata]
MSPPPRRQGWQESNSGDPFERFKTHPLPPRFLAAINFAPLRLALEAPRKHRRVRAERNGAGNSRALRHCDAARQIHAAALSTAIFRGCYLSLSAEALPSRSLVLKAILVVSHSVLEGLGMSSGQESHLADATQDPTATRIHHLAELRPFTTKSAARHTPADAQRDAEIPIARCERAGDGHCISHGAAGKIHRTMDEERQQARRPVGRPLSHPLCIPAF